MSSFGGSIAGSGTHRAPLGLGSRWPGAAINIALLRSWGGAVGWGADSGTLRMTNDERMTKPEAPNPVTTRPQVVRRMGSGAPASGPAWHCRFVELVGPAQLRRSAMFIASRFKALPAPAGRDVLVRRVNRWQRHASRPAGAGVSLAGGSYKHPAPTELERSGGMGRLACRGRCRFACVLSDNAACAGMKTRKNWFVFPCAPRYHCRRY